MEDLGQGWRKSSYSGNGGECVEVGRADDRTILVRDTKEHGQGTACRYTSAGWRVFTAAIRNGATVAELEEVVYHTAGYSGFPAAVGAREVIAEALTKAGMIDRPA